MLSIWLLVAVVAVGVGMLIHNQMNKNDAPASPPHPQSSSQTGKDSHKPEGLRYIREIDESLLGQNVVTTGTITRINEEEGHVFFTLTDKKADKNINCVLFAKTNEEHPENKNLAQKSKNEGSSIYVEGKVNKYKGKLQIITWKVFTK